MIAAIDHWVPPVYRETVRMIASEIDDTIRGFARGQSLLCLVLAVFYSSALSLIGLEHGVLIGIASGLLSFIPYLGALAGLAIATCVAISQFWPDWTMVFFVLAAFFVGQSLADYVLAPYLVGRSVHLNPVWMIFALFAFGYLFGFVGLLIAVPLAAAIGVLIRFALRRTMQARCTLARSVRLLARDRRDRMFPPKSLDAARRVKLVTTEESVSSHTDGTAPSGDCDGSFSGQSADLRGHVRADRGRSDRAPHDWPMPPGRRWLCWLS